MGQITGIFMKHIRNYTMVYHSWYSYFTLAGVTLASLLATSCGSAPTRIEPSSDKGVTSMGVDYNEMLEWAQILTERMLQDGFLDRPEYQPHPVTMVVSSIENKTDISGLSYEMVLGRIRASLLNSGKVQFTAAYGADGVDNMARDTQDLRNDPLFDSSQIPAAGQASVARLGLSIQFLSTFARARDVRENVYEVRMMIQDLRKATPVWEGFSDPIIKVSKRGRIGF